MQKGFNDAIAGKVKNYRQLLRLSQAFVGEKVLEVDRTTYTRMENGKIGFSADDLRKLSNLFRVEAGDFLAPNLSRSSGKRGPLEGEEFLPSGKFHWRNEAAFTSIKNAAKDLVLFAGDLSSRSYVQGRQKRAVATDGRFKTMADALRFCGKRRETFLSGPSLLIDKFIIEEFGIWVSWNPLGPYSGVYLKQGTRITPELKLPLPLIVVNSEHSLERQRFSAAHELAHHLLGLKGKLGSPTRPNSDPEEKEANRFARGLLADLETVQKIIKSSRINSQGIRGSADSVRMAARRLQVAYPELVQQMGNGGIITPGEKRELLRVKARGVSKNKNGGWPAQPFDEAYIRYDEAHLGKKGLYQTDPNCGGPKGPQDLRYLQESSYVEYLRFCKTKAPEELTVVFERVADYVRRKYPKYL